MVAGLAGVLFWVAAGTAATSNPTTQDVTDQPLPGREASAGLQRNMRPTSFEARWRGLPRFGRDLFAGETPALAPLEDAPVGPDYVLGPGDELRVFVSGLADTALALRIDRDGYVILPRTGALSLAGQTFGDAERLIAERLATVLRHANVHVTVGRVRAVEVFVLGEVQRPGKYTLSGMVTALHALLAAGGPTSLGSLRDIQIRRGHGIAATFDLYPFLLEGERGGDARLQAADVVFVGLSHAQIGIQGAVLRPGVFESDGPITLTDLLAMAGGPTPFADLTRVHIERMDVNGGFRLQDLPLNHGRGVDPDSLWLTNHDLVTLQPINERTGNVVTLDGFVRHPGEYELTPGMRLSELVLAERLLPEASLDHLELRRVDPHTFQVRLETCSIRDAWSGVSDPELHPLDGISVFSSARMPRSVTLEGEVTRPGLYTIMPAERLSSLLARAGGVTPAGHLPAAVFLRPQLAAREGEIRREVASRQRLDLALERARLASSGDSAASGAVGEALAEVDAAMLAQGGRGRVVLDLDVRGRWMNTDRDPVMEHGDVFIVPLAPVTVTVMGSVMNPGTVMMSRAHSFDDYLRLAGGPTREADLGRSYVLRSSGAAVPRAGAGRMQPGDAIVVPLRDQSRDGFFRALTGGTRFFMELAAAAALVVAVSR